MRLRITKLKANMGPDSKTYSQLQCHSLLELSIKEIVDSWSSTPRRSEASRTCKAVSEIHRCRMNAGPIRGSCMDMIYLKDQPLIGLLTLRVTVRAIPTIRLVDGFRVCI